LRSRADRKRQARETWSLRFLWIAVFVAVAEFLLPALLAGLRNLGGGTVSDQSADEGSLRAALATTGGSFGVLLATVLAEVRRHVTEPKQLRDDAGQVLKAVRSLSGRARVALAYVVTAVVGPLVILAGMCVCLLILLGDLRWWWFVPFFLVPLVFLAVQIVVVRDLTSWSLHPFYLRPRLHSNA
jgi:hypothetical protein